MIRDATYRYATWERLPDYLALGWAFSAPAGEWSAIVVWLCDCKQRVPTWR